MLAVDSNRTGTIPSKGCVMAVVLQVECDLVGIGALDRGRNPPALLVLFDVASPHGAGLMNVAAFPDGPEIKVVLQDFGQMVSCDGGHVRM